MNLTPAQEQKFKFRARYEAEQAEAMRGKGTATVYPDSTPQSPDDEWQLLDQIAGMNQPPLTYTEPEDTSVNFGQLGSSTLKGLAKGTQDLVNVVPNLGNLAITGINAVAGTEIPRATTVTEMMGVDEAIKPYTTLTPEESESSLNRGAYTTAQWLPGNPLTKAGVKAGTTMAVGAGVGSELARAGFGDDAAIWGELAGGTGTGLTKLGAFLTEKGVNWLGGKVVPGYRAGRIDAADRELMAKVIYASATDPEKALRNLDAALRENIPGNLADWTQDAGIAELLGAREGQNGGLAETLATLSKDRESSLIDTAFPTVDTAGTPLSQTGGEGLRQARAQAEQRTATQLSKADVREQAGYTASEQDIERLNQMVRGESQGLEQSRAALRTPVGPAQASTDVTEQYAKSEKDYAKAVEQPAWDTFKQAPPMDVYELQESVKDYINSLDNTTRDVVSSKYSEELGYIDRLAKPGEAADPKAIQAASSIIKAKLAEAKEFGPAEKRMAKISEMMENYLRSAPGTFYEEAVAATKEKYDRFQPNRVAQARRKREAELTTGQLGYTGTSGVNTVRKAKEADDPAIWAKTETAIRADMRDKLDDPAALMKDNQYGEILGEFPQLKEQIVDLQAKTEELAALKIQTDAGIAGAKDKFAALQAELKTRRAQVNDRKGLVDSRLKSSQLQKFVDDPEGTLRRILTSASDKKPTDALNRLYKAAKRFGGEQRLTQELMAEVRKIVAPAKSEAPRLTAASLDKFNNMKQVLLDSGTMNADEFKFIHDTLKRGADSTARKRAAGSASTDPIPRMGAALNILASVLAMGVTPFIKSGQSLMVNGAVRQYTLREARAMERSGDAHKLAVLDDYITNPAKFAKELESIDPAAYKRIIEGDNSGMARLMEGMRALKDRAHAAAPKTSQRAEAWTEITEPEEDQ